MTTRSRSRSSFNPAVHWSAALSTDAAVLDRTWGCWWAALTIQGFPRSEPTPTVGSASPGSFPQSYVLFTNDSAYRQTDIIVRSGEVKDLGDLRADNEASR